MTSTLSIQTAIAPHRIGTPPPGVLTVTGIVDEAAVAEVRRCLHALIGAGHLRLVVDLRQVPVADETVLGVLVGAWKKVRTTGGWLRLACGPGWVLDRVVLAGLPEIFAVYPSVAAALIDP